MSQFGFGPDILKYASQSNFPATGESNKLYVAKDTNTIFHYDTNEYLQLGGSNVAIMTGASSSAAGTAGLVPAPAQYDNTKYLRGDGTWSNVDAYSLGGIYFDRYSYAGGPTTDYGYLLYQSNPLTSSNTSFMRIQATPTPTAGKIPTYDTGACLKSTTPTANDNSTKVATTAYVDSALANFSGGISGVKLISTSLTPDANGIVTIPAMTGATSSVAGSTGLVPAPTTSDTGKFLAGDGTWKDGGKPMVILSYGSSTWAEFEAAYNNNVIVYCRASSNSNPASGSQTRMAFMAYVNNATTPTNVEFQYYRSVNTHSATQMGDQVFVYKLDKTSGWSVTTREASIKEINVASGSKLGVSWSSNKVTLSNTMTADDMPISSSDATTTKSAIDTLNNNLSSYIATEQFNKSYSVEANNNVSVEYTNISKTGYTPIGIIGFNTRIGAVVPYETGISQDGTKAYMSLRNVTSTARTENALIVVAYIKNL